MAGGRAVLRTLAHDRELLRAQAALALFQAAEYGTWIAILVFAYARGGTTTAGVVALVQLVPTALLAPVLGSLPDRIGGGLALLAGYAAQAVAMTATAGALLAGVHPYVSYGFATLASVAITTTRPAQAVIAPGVARTPEQLTAFNSLSGWSGSAAIMVGPALAGLGLAVTTPGVVFAIGGALLAAAAVLVWPLRGLAPALGRADGQESGRWLSDLRDVLQAEATSQLLLVLATYYTVVGALDILAVTLAVGTLGLGNSGAGYLNAVFGAGSVIGATLSIALVGRARLVPPLLLAALVGGGAFVVLGLETTVVSAITLLVVAGAGGGLLDVTTRTLLQRVTPTALLARVFGLAEGLMMGTIAIGSVAVPGLVGLGGVRLALLGAGALLPAVVVLRLRALLRVDAEANVPVVEIGLLRSMRIFRGLSAPVVEGVARGLHRRAVTAGTPIVREGEPGDFYYAIAEGVVDVVAGGVVLATLHRGEGFGEIALLRDEPRMATVTAMTDVDLYAFERDAFLVALTGHAPALAGAQSIAAERLAANERLLEIEA